MKTINFYPMSEQELELHFKQQFARWGKIGLPFVDKSGNSNITRNCTYGPNGAWKEFKRTGRCHYMNPIFNGMTKLVWFDIDGHHLSRPEQDQKFELACTIYKNLRKYKLTPDFVQSSTWGNFHILLWFELPQSLSYANTVLKRFLASLNFDGPVEVGPGNGKLLRPWFMNKPGSPPGRMIVPGKKNRDLSTLLQFNSCQSNRPIQQPTGLATEVDISAFVPDGVTLFRNDALKSLVRAAKASGWTDEQILDAAERIYKQGVVHNSLETHLAECRRVIKNFNPSFKRGLWNEFWASVPKDLNDKALLIKAWKFAQSHNLPAMVLTARATASYWGISIKSASFRLKKLLKEELIIVHKLGSKNRATLYKPGSKLLNNSDKWGFNTKSGAA